MHVPNVSNIVLDMAVVELNSLSHHITNVLTQDLVSFALTIACLSTVISLDRFVLELDAGIIVQGQCFSWRKVVKGLPEISLY